jgi:hypothetical protein
VTRIFDSDSRVAFYRERFSRTSERRRLSANVAKRAPFPGARLVRGMILVPNHFDQPMTMLTTSAPSSVARYDPGKDHDPELIRLVPVWNGILHEFRNHLTVLLAAATEVRAAVTPALAREISEALTETEWNVQRLNALVAFVDAAIRDGAPMVADLDDVIERALRLAAPTLGRATVSFRKERRTGVGNRGSALESLLAALIVDLARSGGLQIEICAESSRGVVVLEIESGGGRPSITSWRFVLASDLAARIGATVTTRAEGAGYLVRLA